MAQNNMIAGMAPLAITNASDKWVRLKFGSQTWVIARDVFTKHSWYAKGCFRGEFKEAKSGVVTVGYEPIGCFHIREGAIDYMMAFIRGAERNETPILSRWLAPKSPKLTLYNAIMFWFTADYSQVDALAALAAHIKTHVSSLLANPFHGDRNLRCFAELVFELKIWRLKALRPMCRNAIRASALGERAILLLEEE